jgi:DNA-binding Lrp family transcriptional regulator
VELADRLGLTPPPCLRRVKRLEAAGYITGYRAVLNPELTGRAFEVMVAVRVGPGAGDQPTMPAQQRLGLHKEARPA